MLILFMLSGEILCHYGVYQVVHILHDGFDDPVLHFDQWSVCWIQLLACTLEQSRGQLKHNRSVMDNNNSVLCSLQYFLVSGVSFWACMLVWDSYKPCLCCLVHLLLPLVGFLPQKCSMIICFLASWELPCPSLIPHLLEEFWIASLKMSIQLMRPFQAHSGKLRLLYYYKKASLWLLLCAIHIALCRFFLMTLFSVISTILVIVITTPIFLVVILPLGLVYFLIQVHLLIARVCWAAASGYVLVIILTHNMTYTDYASI